jgi:hypothetical protein
MFHLGQILVKIRGRLTFPMMTFDNFDSLRRNI